MKLSEVMARVCTSLKSVAMATAVAALLAIIAAAGDNGTTRLHESQIASIEIAKQGQEARKLDKVRTRTFIESWNRSDPEGLCKYAVEYWIHVYLATGERITFRTNGPHLKAADDHCFAVKEPRLFDSIWDASVR